MYTCPERNNNTNCFNSLSRELVLHLPISPKVILNSYVQLTARVFNIRCLDELDLSTNYNSFWRRIARISVK